MDLRAKPFYLTDEDITWVEKTLAGMTVDEKIRHLFCMIAYDAEEANLTAMAEEVKPCGVMFRPFTTDQALDVAQILQSKSKIPMLIAANLERGGNGIATDGTQLGYPMQLAATDDPIWGHRLGEVSGKEGAAVGGNWAFAPIIDIDYNWRNPITNLRTFGSDPERVKAFGEAYVRAVQAEGVAASIKHFPGDGRDERDQHLVISINDSTCEEWDKTYGEVYKASIDAGALTVMIGHIMLPAYTRALRPEIADKDMLPGSLAPELLGDLLRGKLGFNGLIVSDATTMAGFCVPLGREKAVPACIAAGCDVFLFAKNMEEDIEFMRRGYEDGVITEERLNEAITRILGLKAALKLHKKNNVPNKARAAEIVGCPKHRQWVKDCADQSVTLVKDNGGILPISPKTHKRVQLIGIKADGEFYGGGGTQDIEAEFKRRLEGEGFEVEVFVPSSGMEGRTAKYGDTVDNFDLILYVANLSTKSNQTTVRIDWAQPMGANCPNYSAVVPTIFVSLANPYHLIDVPRVPVMINGYTCTSEVMDAIIDKLLGKSAFKGVSPVDAFCGKWDTHL